MVRLKDGGPAALIMPKEDASFGAFKLITNL